MMVARTLPANEGPALLHEFDKEEWRSVVKRLRPEWTEEDFEASWAEFAAMKQRKALS